MLRHVALFKWKPDTSAEQIQAVSDGLATLPALIPEILRYEFGPDLGLRAGGYDFAIVADFDDEEGYRRYLEDAEHDRIVAEVVRPIAEIAARVQYLV